MSVFYNEIDHREEKMRKVSRNAYYYILIFSVWIYEVFKFGDLGKIIIAPLTAAMFLTAIVAIKRVKQDKENIIRTCKKTVGGYILGLFIYNLIVSRIYDLDYENLTNSLGYNATPGLSNLGTFLSTSFLFIMVMVPLGYIVATAKKIGLFDHGSQSKQDTMRHLKEHGNNGQF